MRASGWIVSLCVLATGCGGARAAFDTRFPDNERPDLALALDRIGPPAAPGRPANALGRPLVVAAVQGRTEVFAADLASGRRLWSRPGRVDSRPVVGGNVAVYASGAHIVCLNLQSGAEMWRLPREGREFRGAAVGDGGVYVTLGEPQSGSTSSEGRSIVLGLDAESGSTRFRHEVDHMVAAPGIAGSVVAVPWDRQNLSLLDSRGGDEIARVRSTDDVFSFAVGTRSGLYYGSRGVYRLTDRSAEGNRREAAYYQPTIADLPGEPSFGHDGYSAQVEGRNARDRIRFYWSPAPGPSGVSFTGGSIYLLYYRYVFAFSADGYAPRWVHRNRADITSFAVTSGGPIFVDDQGGVGLLDPDSGVARWHGSIGAPILAATIDADGFSPAAGAPQASLGLRRSLLDVIFDQDNRLAAARAFAVKVLSKLQDAEITGDLIEIAGRRSLSPPIRTAASQALLDRRMGGDAVLEALGRRYSFLDGNEAPPVGMLARAAVAMSLRQAVPGLIRHLQSHETAAAALPDVVSAIVQLGDRSAAAPLRDFVVRYHADDVLGDHHGALAVAAAGALRLGGTEEVAAMRTVADDPFCLRDVAAAIRATLPEVAPVAESPEQPPETPPETPAGEPAPAEPTRFLSEVRVHEILADHLGTMRDCVIRNRSGPSLPARVRVVFIIFADGHTERTTISPPNPPAEQCIAEIVATVQFPRILEERQQITMWLPIRSPGIRPPAGSPAAPAEPGSPPARPVAPAGTGATTPTPPH